jgi:hypothetical protein
MRTKKLSRRHLELWEALTRNYSPGDSEIQVGVDLIAGGLWL